MGTEKPSSAPPAGLVEKLLQEGEHAEFTPDELKDEAVDREITAAKKKMTLDREKLLASIEAWQLRNVEKKDAHAALEKLRANLPMGPWTKIGASAANTALDAGRMGLAALDGSATDAEKQKAKTLLAGAALSVAGVFLWIVSKAEPKRRQKMKLDVTGTKEVPVTMKGADGKEIPVTEEYYTPAQKVMRFLGITFVASSIATFLYGAAGARAEQVAKAKKANDVARGKEKPIATSA